MSSLHFAPRHYPALTWQDGDSFSYPSIVLQKIKLTDMMGLASWDQMLGVPFTWISGSFYFLPKRIYKTALHLNPNSQIFFLALFLAQIFHCIGFIDFIYWVIQKLWLYFE